MTDKMNSPTLGAEVPLDESTVAEMKSDYYLSTLLDHQDVIKNRFNGVMTVVVVLSSRAMVYDVESLRKKIHEAYPDAAIWFRTTSGKPLGSVNIPKKIDLIIDLTGPGQRQPLFYALKLRAAAKNIVGRNAGLFRKSRYDRLFDEKKHAGEMPKDMLQQERLVQRQVLALAGVAFIPTKTTTPDRSKVIALELPPLSRD